MRASHYPNAPHYITSFDHDYELVPEHDTTVIIDYRNSGNILPFKECVK